jgi:uroporphyrinogen decarboxylase
MLNWQRLHGFDFLKVNPRAQYHAETWGGRYAYSGQPHVKPQLVELPVKDTADWGRLRVMPVDKGPLGEQLDALRLIGDGLRGEVPFVETVFSPLSVLGYLAEHEMLLRDMREHPDAIHTALTTVTETFAKFAQTCVDVGATGIFFATTAWATKKTLTEAQYAEFGRPYDLRVLAAVQGACFNLLHVCREESMLYALSDYPVQGINWAATSPTNPSLAEAKTKIAGKALIGGISDGALTASGTEKAIAETKAAFRQTGGRQWILAGDCSIPTASNDANIKAIKATLEQM